MGRFLDLTKQIRYEELREELADALARPWTWPRLYELMAALGLHDINGYMASGWWVPQAIGSDPDKLEQLTVKLEKAIARGELPDPETEYGWQEIETLGDLCNLNPSDLVDALLWAYTLTMAENMFKEHLQAVAAKMQGNDV